MAHRLHRLTSSTTTHGSDSSRARISRHRRRSTVGHRAGRTAPRRRRGVFSAVTPPRRAHTAARRRRSRGRVVPAHRLTPCWRAGATTTRRASTTSSASSSPTIAEARPSCSCPAMLTRRDPAAMWPCGPRRRGPGRAEFVATIGRAAEIVAARPDVLLVIGLAPPCPRPPGWIEPGEVMAGLATFGVRAVRRFLRRPSFAQASLLQRNGGLVNTGVVVAQARTLLDLGRRRLPDVLETLEPSRPRSAGRGDAAVEAVYEGMHYDDLSLRSSRRKSPSAAGRSRTRRPRQAGASA